VPVGLEAGDNFRDLAAVLRRDRIVARLRQILCLPVERLDERRLIVHYHGLFMGYRECGIAVDNLDTRLLELFAGSFVLRLAAAAQSDALIVLPEGERSFDSGDVVEVLPF